MFLFLLSSESLFDEVKVNQLFRNNHQNPVTPFKSIRHHLPGNQEVKPPSGEILVFFWRCLLSRVHRRVLLCTLHKWQKQNHSYDRYQSLLSSYTRSIPVNRGNAFHQEAQTPRKRRHTKEQIHAMQIWRGFLVSCQPPVPLATYSVAILYPY